MDSLRRHNSLAHISGHFETKDWGQISVYLSFNRSEKIIDFCYWAVESEELLASFHEVHDFVIGENLSSLAQKDASARSELFYQLLSLVDQAINSYRRGDSTQALERLNLKEHLMCPCHSLTGSDLAQAVSAAPNADLAQLQAQLGFGVTCTSCLEGCKLYIDQWRAAQRLVAAKSVEELIILGRTQAKLALEVQQFLDQREEGIEVLGLNGFELRLSATSASLELLLRQHFRVNFLISSGANH